MYVGQAVSLRRRFGEYLNERNLATARPHILRVLNKYPKNVFFCYTLVDSVQLNSVENGLIEAYIPPQNKNLPASIRRIMGAFSNV